MTLEDTQGGDAEPQDVTVEKAPEVKVEETEVDTSPDTENEEGEAAEELPEESVEDKVDRLERETTGKQKAIDRKTAAYSSLQRKYEEQRQEHEKLAQLIAQQQPKVEPNIDDFETHEEYDKARVEFWKETAKAEAQAELLQNQRQFQQEKIMQDRLVLRQTQEVEYMTDNPMYKASVTEVDSYIKGIPDVPGGTQEAVIEQLYRGNVPQLIDYFGSNAGENLDELGKISRLSPPEAAVEIYKLQQKLSSSKVKKETTPKTTPVKTQKGSTSTSKPLSKRSGKEVLDWVNK